MTDNRTSFIAQSILLKKPPLYYVVGILAVACGYLLGQLPLVWVQMAMVQKYHLGVAVVKQFLETNDFSLLHISANLGFFLMLCMFVGAWMAYLVLLKLQNIPLLTTLTGRKKFDFSRYLFGFGVWMGLTALIELFFYLNKPSLYHFHFSVSQFLPLLILGLTLVPLQAAMEEVFFRGYLLQGIYSVSSKIMVSIILSTLFFSAVHSMNPEIAKYGFWTMQFYYLAAGIFLAVLAVTDNGLELSMGIHAATNVFGSVFVKYEGSVLQTQTLFEQKLENPWPMILSFYLSAGIMTWLCHKRYRLSFAILKDVNLRPIEPIKRGND